ncbi:MAG: leucine-rich repeat domain-containing protein [Acutalibacteraceae bacterium]
MKKLLPVLMCLCLILSTFTFVSISASAEISGDYTYSVTNGKATIISCNKSLSGLVRIPSTLGGYSVKGIGSRAFSGYTSLTSIVIPNSVTRIGSNAFSGCTSLTTVRIPNSVTKIDYQTFSECSSLAKVTLGNKIKSIGWDAFYNCTSLLSISIPASVTSIGYSSFKGCSSLKSIKVNSSNSAYCSVKGVLFNKNKTTLVCYPEGKQFTKYIVPNSVNKIVDYAFYNCKSITNVRLSNRIVSIGEFAFYNCTSLSSVAIPNSVKTIGSGAFKECQSMTSVILGEKVTEINDYAFYGCSKMKKVAIHKDVNIIGEKAFGYYNIDEIHKITDLKIIGEKETEAEKYAKANGLSFQELCNDKDHIYKSTNVYNETYFSAGLTSCECEICGNCYLKDIAKLKLNTPSVKYSVSKKKLKVTYKNVTNATGFQLHYKVKGKWQTKTYNTKKSATKAISLKKGNYKVQIRAFIKQDGNKAYSAWSKTKTVKVK